jgi:hypothetical protein
MATKKKSAKKLKKTGAKVRAKKAAPKARTSGKSASKSARSRSTQAKSTRKKSAQSKSAAPTKKLGKKAASGKTLKVATDQPRRKQPTRAGAPFSRDLTGPGSAGQSGDLQGLSNMEGADSESVDELIEEGNAFEAGVVTGVEEADDSGVREVHTHEVPEDDVPGEYLDEE